MKKTKLILIFMIFILFLSSSTLAVKEGNILVSINGGKIEVREVPVLLDGQTLVSDVPSFILIDRTMVPIRMIGESYGADVDWNGETKTVTITYEDKKIDITIDSPRASINDEIKILDKNSIPRLVSFSDEYANTMVPLAFISEVLDYEVGYDEEARVPFINSKQEEEKIEEEKKPDIEKPIIDGEKKIKLIKEIKVEVIDGKRAIVVYGADLKEYKTMSLNNPDRYVIDFLDANYEKGDYYEEDADAGFINRFRVSQFSPDNNYNKDDRIVRLVLDMKSGIIDPKFKITSGKDKVTIYPQENSWENIEYTVEGRDRFLKITNKEKTDYSLEYFERSKLLRIKIPTNESDLREGNIIVKDGIIDNIDIEETTKATLVSVNFQRSIEYKLLSDEIDDNILLSFRRDSDILPKDRIIVLDPGHGGKDPGAISPNGTREKDVNFKITLKVKKLLEDIGYKVLMTREDDSELSIYDRAYFANDAKADLFISIHANASARSRDINGVEILYCPAYKGDKEDQEQYPFAKAMLDAMIKGTGANDRGIKQRSDLPVVRMTNMPAVLVEVGYLTNEEEEKLILNDKYQDKISKSIANGIENYFEIY